MNRPPFQLLLADLDAPLVAAWRSGSAARPEPAWFIVGLAVPKHWLERDVAAPAISFAPMAPGAELGASVVGRF